MVLFLLEQAVQIWARKLHHRPSDGCGCPRRLAANSRRGQHSPCGGGRSLSPWATSLSVVTAGVVELFVMLALACQSSCVLTRISRFRLWASFLRIWLRSFSFTNSDSKDIWRFTTPLPEPPPLSINNGRCNPTTWEAKRG